MKKVIAIISFIVFPALAFAQDVCRAYGANPNEAAANHYRCAEAYVRASAANSYARPKPVIAIGAQFIPPPPRPTFVSRYWYHTPYYYNTPVYNSAYYTTAAVANAVSAVGWTAVYVLR